MYANVYNWNLKYLSIFKEVEKWIFLDSKLVIWSLRSNLNCDVYVVTRFTSAFNSHMFYSVDCNIISCSKLEKVWGIFGENFIYVELEFRVRSYFFIRLFILLRGVWFRCRKRARKQCDFGWNRGAERGQGRLHNPSPRLLCSMFREVVTQDGSKKI